VETGGRTRPIAVSCLLTLSVIRRDESFSAVCVTATASGAESTSCRRLSDEARRPRPSDHADVREVLHPIHIATPDPTKKSCLCCVCLGGVKCILGNSRLSPTENRKSEHVSSNCPVHTATPDTTQTGLFCRVWCGLSRPDRALDRCVLCPVCVGVRRAVAAVAQAVPRTPDRPHAATLYATQNIKTLWTVA